MRRVDNELDLTNVARNLIANIDTCVCLIKRIIILIVASIDDNY